MASHGISFYGAISSSRSAIKRSGSIEGGASVTFEIPESQIGVIAALIGMVGKPLHISVKTVDQAVAELAENEIPEV